MRERFARPSSSLDPSDCLWVLDKCVESVLRGKRERKIAERDWRRKLSTTSADYEDKIKVDLWTPLLFSLPHALSFRAGISTVPLNGLLQSVEV